jgi:chromosome segregation ATPase
MEQVIIEIQVDNNDASKKLLEVEKALQKNRQRQEELRKSIKQARAEGREASEEELLELAKVEQSVKQLSSARNTYSKVLASESNTLKALRAEVSKLNLERETLDTSTVEGAKRFAELTKTLKEYNEQINSASKASGNLKDNICNYE